MDFDLNKITPHHVRSYMAHPAGEIELEQSDRVLNKMKEKVYSAIVAAAKLDRFFCDFIVPSNDMYLGPYNVQEVAYGLFDWLRTREPPFNVYWNSDNHNQFKMRIDWSPPPQRSAWANYQANFAQSAHPAHSAHSAHSAHPASLPSTLPASTMHPYPFSR